MSEPKRLIDRAYPCVSCGAPGRKKEPDGTFCDVHAKGHCAECDHPTADHEDVTPNGSYAVVWKCPTHGCEPHYRIHESVPRCFECGGFESEDEECAELDKALAAAEARGASAERQRIVAWLRGHDPMLAGIAEAIERGEHLAVRP